MYGQGRTDRGRTLLTRVPHLELAVPAYSLAWFPSGMVRGVLYLPVRYRTADALRQGSAVRSR
ncbi:hypothetical protein SSP24_03600 [Streptomyces spinoverrucosus]|uniref:Uncharacterized protein n=1 Tax=Streptomyces spinoverrucosus TaxID=284043 RepID=A0A4Y3V8F3_9ACTN|nr:hypothetical protein SSP24_03600 [Streptomyces spinoverrucosus]GHB41075.1 hypothetical protein GCM10010397_09000 [Streptomyces spinoverrucosus]